MKATMHIMLPLAPLASVTSGQDRPNNSCAHYTLTFLMAQLPRKGSIPSGRSSQQSWSSYRTWMADRSRLNRLRKHQPEADRSGEAIMFVSHCCFRCSPPFGIWLWRKFSWINGPQFRRSGSLKLPKYGYAHCLRRIQPLGRFSGHSPPLISPQIPQKPRAFLAFFS